MLIPTVEDPPPRRKTRDIGNASILQAYGAAVGIAVLVIWLLVAVSSPAGAFSSPLIPILSTGVAALMVSVAATVYIRHVRRSWNDDPLAR